MKRGKAVKKIPNVLPPRPRTPYTNEPNTIVQSSEKQLAKERQKNHILQLEIERLRKSLEVCQRSLNTKNDEIEQKNRTINKLMEKKIGCEPTLSPFLNSNDIRFEDELDFDNLLKANLGDSFGDILNMSSTFDVANLENMESLAIDQHVTLSPKSLGMATNTSYYHEENVQKSNKNDSKNATSSSMVSGGNNKAIVERILEQKVCNVSSSGLKVSPLKLQLTGDKYKLVGRNTPKNVEDEFKSKTEESRRSTPQSLKCEFCQKSFPMGGKWKLRRHMQKEHSKEISVCNYCDKEFTSESVLKAHLQRHKAGDPFNCNVCSYKGNLETIIKHIKCVHQIKNVTNVKNLMEFNLV